MEDQEKRQQAKEAWRRAREEMREAFRRAWREVSSTGEDEGHESFDAFVQNVVVLAKDFGSEVGGQARRFGQDFAEDARKQADEAWKGVRDEWRHRQRHHHEHRQGDWQEHWLFGGRRFQQWVGGDEEANPFLAAMMSKGGGLLSVYLLQLLSQQPRHGNDLMKEIERRTMGGWSSNPGAVYPLLSSMESNGLVLSSWEDPDKRTRRTYQITDKGREELDRLKQVLRPKLMDTIDVLNDIYDDLYSAGGEEGPGSGGDTVEASPAAPEEGESGGEGKPPAEDNSAPLASSILDGMRSLLDKVFGQHPRQVAVSD